MKFYEMFLDFCRSKESVFSEEFEKVIEFRDDGYSGKGWDHVDPKLGDIIWPIEEASWLRLTYDTQKLSTGLRKLASYIEEKSDLHNAHMLAWARNLKTLYYLRSEAISRADIVSDQVKREILFEQSDCLACEG